MIGKTAFDLQMCLQALHNSTLVIDELVEGLAFVGHFFVELHCLKHKKETMKILVQFLVNTKETKN